MENHKKDISSEAHWISMQSIKDEVTYNKIHRHLTDINDIISEEDIRNVKIIAVATEKEMTIPVNHHKKTIE